jgi:rubrerythrin
MTETTERKGALRYVGARPLSSLKHFWECDTCKTLFPSRSHGSPTCNGHPVAQCPWCREDSKPWKAGRGK